MSRTLSRSRLWLRSLKVKADAPAYNDISGIAANATARDDGYDYNLVPWQDGDGITLGAGGLTATTTSTARGTSNIAVPCLRWEQRHAGRCDRQRRPRQRSALDHQR